MEQPITVRYRWTADEFLLGLSYAGTSSRKWALLAFAPALLFSIELTANHDWVGLPVALYFLLYGGYLLFGRRWQARREFARHPDAGAEVVWQMTEEGFTNDDGHSHSEAKWAAVWRVVATPKGFLFYATPSVFSWLPRHGFEDDASFAQLADLARSKVERFRVVR